MIGNAVDLAAFGDPVWPRDGWWFTFLKWCNQF